MKSAAYRLLAGFVILTVLASSTVSGFAAAATINPQPEPPGNSAISVYVDGVRLILEDVVPAIVGGRTMVPMRAIFEALGADVAWNDAAQSVTATKGALTINLTVGSRVAAKNGVKVELDAPPVIVSSRTLVPLRFVGEALGATVDWSDKERKVTVVSASPAKTGSPGATGTGTDPTIDTGTGIAIDTGRLTGFNTVSDLPAGINFSAGLTSRPNLAHRANSYSFQPISATDLLVSTRPGKPAGTASHKYVKGDGVFIDWSMADQEWWFKWVGPLQNLAKPESVVTSAVWQVSLLPFAGDSDNWRNPPGLLASGRLTAAEKEFAIDFADFLAGPAEVNGVWLSRITAPLVRNTLASSLQQSNLATADRDKLASSLLAANTFIRRVNSSGQSSGIVSGLTLSPSPQDFDCPSCTAAANAGAKRLTASLLPLPARKYYVRVVPLNARDECVGVPSTAREVVYGRPEITLSGATGTSLLISPRDERPHYETSSYGQIDDWQIDWKQPDPVRWFKWTTNKTGVVYAYWQVSAVPFAAGGEDWRNARGILASGILGATEYEFPIHFGDFAPRPGTDAAFIPLQQPGVLAPCAASTGVSGMTSVSPGSISSGSGLLFTVPQLTKPELEFSIRNNWEYLLAAGGKLRFYIRVIPVVASYDGKYTGYPSDTRSVYYGEAGETIQVYPEMFEPLRVEIVAPNVKVQNYQPIQFEDPNWIYRFVVYKEPGDFPWKGLFQVGQKLDLTPKPEDKGFWDYVGDAFDAVFSFVVDAINWVSDAWDSLKATCIDIVASAIPFCDDPCKAGLNLALNAGLAALGVPPSLPNFEQLLDGGVEYLAATMAAEAGVPAEAVEYGLDKLVDEVESAGSQAPGGPPLGLDFIKPDPDFQYRNATLNIVLTNSTNLATTPGYLTVDDADPWAKDVFRPVNLPVPALQPGQTVHIPIYLAENNDYFNLSITNPLPLPMSEWIDLYWHGTAKLTIQYHPSFAGTEVAELIKSFGFGWESQVEVINKGGNMGQQVTFATKSAYNF